MCAVKEGMFVKNKSGQVTLFIIIAIVLVALIVLFLVFGGSDSSSANIPDTFEPAYTHFLSCLDEEVLIGVNLLETYGGYIDSPSFEAGSSYAPFSSELTFLGTTLPYWYYLSGNNLPKERVPTLASMEHQLEAFLDARIQDCQFNSFIDEGFVVSLGESTSSVSIRDDSIEVTLDMPFAIADEETSFTLDRHTRSVDSHLGTLYDAALQVYDTEQSTLFLENYTLDALRFYAPVDGFEVSCSPLVWQAETVFANLSSAIEANILALTGQNDGLTLQREEDTYFVKDFGVDADVRFLTSKDWASVYEVNPTEGASLIAQPVGNQPGLELLGFCYVPYHFVYSVRYPVLVQLTSGDEVFQFPVVVAIENNKPRESLNTSALARLEPLGICDNKNTLTEVNVFSANLQPIDAEVSFSCSYETCDLGTAVNGVLRDNLPQCGNGILHAEAPGYVSATEVYSSFTEGSVSLILDPLYDRTVQLNLGGRAYNGQAIVTFTTDDSSQSLVYPEQRTVSLHAGTYDITVYALRNSTFTLGESVVEQCADVPRSGLGGILGFTKEECFEVTFPEQLVSRSLVGGGTTTASFSTTQLQASNGLTLFADDFGTPTSITELSNNYVLFEGSDVEVVVT